MSATADQVIAKAVSQLGKHYSRPNGVSPYGAWYAERVGDRSFRTAPWCAMFISWCAAQVGATNIIPIHAYTPSGVSWFKSRGQWHTRSPKRGDLVYYKFSGPRVHHVGIVERVHSDGSVTAIEGNTSGTAGGSQRNGGVVARKRRKTGIVGFGRPNYGSAPSKRSGDWLKIFFGNIANGNDTGQTTWDSRKGALVREIASADADVIALCEVGGSRYLDFLDRRLDAVLTDGQRPDYERVPAGGKSRHIWRKKSTTQFKDSGFHTFSAVVGGKSMYLHWAALDVEGTEALVYLVHLISGGTNEAERARASQVKELVDHAEENRKKRGIGRSRVVIAGDFNTTNEATLRPLAGLGFVRADKVAASASNAGLVSFVGWSGRKVAGEPIDMIFVHAGDRPVRKTNLRIVPGLSDHGFPVAILQRQGANPSPPTPENPGRVLRRGTTGEDVRALQAGLNRVFPSYSKLVVDGDFGPKTESVVQQFQHRSNLVRDGIVGPATRTALSSHGINL